MIMDKILKDSRNTGIFSSPEAMQKSKPAWFSLAFIISYK